MWALINKSDNSITEILSFRKAVTIDNITHPKAIFDLWSEEDLNNIGIYTVEAKTGMKDEKFYSNSEPEYKFDSTNKKVTSTVTATEKSLNDLKTQAIKDTNNNAYNLIKRVSWLVERSIYDSSKAIPDVVKKYVAAIQKDADDITTEITNASDINSLIAIYTDELNTDGSIKTVNRFNRWTSDSTVTDYIR